MNPVYSERGWGLASLSGPRLMAALLAISATGCEQLQPIPLAPADAVLSLSASPQTLPPGGTADIRIVGLQADGLPLPAQTQLLLTTSLGSVDAVVLTDSSGIAHATFQADQNEGTAELIATSGLCPAASLSITVARQLGAEFSFNQDGLTAIFDNLSTGPVETVLWSFGDGSESAEDAPVHVFEAGGTYVVTLTVSNAWEQASSAQFITLTSLE